MEGKQSAVEDALGEKVKMSDEKRKMLEPRSKFRWRSVGNERK